MDIWPPSQRRGSDSRRTFFKRVGILCLGCLLLSGCVRHTRLAITSHYAFPVEVDDVTPSDSSYRPQSLGIVAPNAVLNADLVGGGTLYILDVRHIHGKSIKRISVTCDEETLVIGR